MIEFDVARATLLSSRLEFSQQNMSNKKIFENNVRDRFVNDSVDDNELFSPIRIHSNNLSTDNIDWLDQYTNAYRIDEIFY